MSTKTKTTAVAALAALTLPAGALAHGGDRADQAHKTNTERKSHKTHKAHKAHGKAFVVKGVDAANLTVTDGALAGPLTLDPTSANRHARRALELTKAELRGEDTVTFGTAGDKLVIRYVGLQSTDALAPTDVVKVIGKVNRAGVLDIRKITVKRGETAETQS